ncbi:DUF4922 domain-containing protein [Bacteroidaceae bacterium HV4-6-C5C]|jgi:ATP adenylyltransferase (5'',5''''''-P-1,P-4-tetraphosphate phosphorylase II)|nr:DUF4922 domain-containing protein [Bacteroidaceae bacterium HV4-6-C5C]
MNQKVKNLFAEQFNDWELARNNYNALSGVRVKELNVAGIPYKVQFNPARIVSSGAKVDSKSIKERKCFLCPANLPKEQKGIPFLRHYQILINPFPIFPRHLTIPELEHAEQRIETRFGDMLELAKDLPEYVIFYNGPKCGASAPDHAHFQAGNKGFMPIEQTWRQTIAGRILDYGEATLWYLKDAPRNTLIIEATEKEDAEKLFKNLYACLTPLGRSCSEENSCLEKEEKMNGEEPMMNVLAWYENKRTNNSKEVKGFEKGTGCTEVTEATWVICVFPREKHRPACYTAEGDANLLSSPASVDLGGVFILPVEKDFLKIGAPDIEQILTEVCLSEEKFNLLRRRIKENIA